MGHSIGEWSDRVRNRCGDLGHIQRIENHDIVLGISQALVRFAGDLPRVASGSFAGDSSTFDFDLSTVTGWTSNWSKVQSVEYPAGQRVPSYLQPGHSFLVLDDTLRLLEDTPATGENVEVRVSATWPMPTEDPTVDLVVGPYFEAVAALAAAETLRGIAGEHVRGRSKAIAGEIFVDTDAQAVFSQIDRLEAYYTNVVGTGTATSDGTQGGSDNGVNLVVSDVDVSKHSLFHGGRR